MKRTLALFSGIVISFMVGCQQKPTSASIPETKRDTSITVANSYTEMFFDSVTLEKFIGSGALNDSAARRLRDFYNGRNFQFAWFLKQGMAPYVSSFMDLQNEYISYSGDSTLYNPTLQLLYDSLVSEDSMLKSDSVIVKTELLLTLQFFRYVNRAYAGRGNINLQELEWYIPRKKINDVALLDSLLNNVGKDLSKYEPVNRQYGLIKNYLLKYYRVEKNGGWTKIKTDKKTYQQGDSSTTISQIKRRLFLTEDLQANDTTRIFTPALTEAVKSYQRRHGYKETGFINVSIVDEMNRPVHERIRQMLINMERIRWVPAEPPADYLLVNIPEFRLHVYGKGQYKWNMNVVTGSVANNTVIFSGTLKYIVFSPYWNVPPGILKKEVLPGIKKNKNYLADHNMEWNNGAVRQKPGPRNSLGLVKFLFPNSYSIYFHDTPSKSLFDEPKRAFSHGCIRLAEPQKLAEYLLRNDPSWNSEKISKAMHAGKEKYVTIKEDIPVIIGYFTAWVDRQGKLNFRDDIYGHDKKMAERLFSTARK